MTNNTLILILKYLESDYKVVPDLYVQDTDVLIYRFDIVKGKIHVEGIFNIYYKSIRFDVLIHRNETQHDELRFDVKNFKMFKKTIDIIYEKFLDSSELNHFVKA